MIEKVLEAYEAELAQNKSLAKILRKMNLLMKCIFVGNIIITIVICFLPLFIRSYYVFLGEIIFYSVVHVEIMILERVRHKKWEKNIKEYNEELDRIAGILKRNEYNMYDKIKIKQLIRKYREAINQHNQKHANKSNELKDFLYTFIVPIIAFSAGKINATSFSSDSEWIAIGGILIIIVVFIKFVYSSLVELAGMISWNVLEKEKSFVPKLQDLLDRDFAIEQEDLISL